ncbi:MAG: gas vesicle protein GvpO [Bacillota bacterium]
MDVEKCLTVAQDFVRRNIGELWKIIGVTPREDGWTVKVEIIEEDEYMRRHGRDELLAEYDVDVDQHFEIVSYRRTGFRHRGEIPTSEGTQED